MAQQHIISDMTIAKPSDALSADPKPDKWLILPYEGPEISGKMIWAPSRSMPPDIEIPLPALGRCKIYIGIYSSGTVPYWFNLTVPKGTWDPNRWHRVQLRLSSDDHDAALHPMTYPNEPRFNHISERYWKTAELKGQSLVVRGRRKEVYLDAMSFIAFVRLVPVDANEREEKPEGRPWQYFDGTNFAHGCEDVEDVKNFLLPAAEQGVKTVFWNTSREDSCYYKTKVGNILPNTDVPGNYPFYCGRDLQRMIAKGLDPLKVVCDIAHKAGMKLFGSYRRMTYRMPPFVYPLHENALMAKRRDLWCQGIDGKPRPHLSLAFPEVRKRMVDILTEQVRDYEVDGVHMFFCRGVPFVGYEKPFMEAFEKQYPGVDPRKLPVEDERPWEIRGKFFTTYLRELRKSIDEAAAKRGRPAQIAMHVHHCVKICRYYGQDIPTIIREKLVDILIPAPSPFLPRTMTDWPEVRGGIIDTNQIKTDGIMVRAQPEHVEEFLQLAKGSGVEIITDEAMKSPYKPASATDHRPVYVTSFDGITIDGIEGVPTCG